MNFAKLKTAFLLLGILMLWGCNTDDESPVILQVTAERLQKQFEADDHILFTINTFANTGELARLTVVEKSMEYDRTTLLDTLLQGTNANFDFRHVVRSHSQPQTVTLIFEASNTNGNSISVQQTYSVLADGELLQELSGNTMHTRASGKADGYSFANASLIVTEVTDSSLTDIYAYQDSADTETFGLTKQWRSKTEVKFVRFNDFDYSRATQKSVRNAYLAGNLLASVTNLANDDVILLGRGSEPLGVVKIIAVFDEAGIMDDRYIFSIKFIAKTPNTQSTGRAEALTK